MSTEQQHLQEGSEPAHAASHASRADEAATVDGAFTAARASWGFPSFAKAFPRHAELDALVVAFTRGDYGTVREGAPKLARATTDEAVKRAALELRERIEPDGTSKVLILLTAALLVFLTVWWVAHDGPEGNAPAKPPQAVEPSG